MPEQIIVMAFMLLCQANLIIEHINLHKLAYGFGFCFHFLSNDLLKKVRLHPLEHVRMN